MLVVFLRLIWCLFPLQLQFRVVHLWLHGGGVCHRLSGSLGANIPLQSGRVHRGESALHGGELRLLRQVAYMWIISLPEQTFIS